MEITIARGEGLRDFLELLLTVFLLFLATVMPSPLSFSSLVLPLSKWAFLFSLRRNFTVPPFSANLRLFHRSATKTNCITTRHLLFLFTHNRTTIHKVFSTVLFFHAAFIHGNTTSLKNIFFCNFTVTR